MEAKKKYAFEPDYAVPPGETLLEVMNSLDMTQKELAIRTNLTPQTLNRIFNGKQPITFETANRLELVTNVTANFWNNLEVGFQEQNAKLAERERIATDIEWLKSIPTNELIQRGLIEPLKDKVMLLREVLRFYGVSSVTAWNLIWAKPQVAARRSPHFDSQPGSASAWIRQGELQAQAIECEPYDKNRFMAALEEIRTLTRETPEIFEPKMRALCAQAGVAIALVKEMKRVPWSGATKWLGPHKAMILLSLRGKAEDKFWFSFFHEASHVLHDGKKDLFIDDGNRDDLRETRADKFSAEFLIPAKYNTRIENLDDRIGIIELAHELEIAPGIVAGRYQFLTEKWNYHKDLIRGLVWEK
uniref:Addiction module antidote protein, HigA family n=1 Tax=Candidatus Kentrum sp. TUN TaxID=2126343 RepID=A0A451A3T5_9GAMM|nr:MAG: addiction module antidote protein, HigA family [Candidatus Kentron sp. TUN]VFK58809.1 MAG: addiction module antidote protein, HigA family [Candidatus Kentron sp. TUN]VFK60686.1 MAG: addiction module antidote protein, HigA family [Candidatus Kentron sp. TUN]